MQSSLDREIELRRTAPARYPESRFEGRGIVICAGGKRYFTCAWVLISILRRVHRTALPIQVWHLGRREMSDEMQLLLSEEGIEIVDAEAVVARHPARLAGGWPLKPYAIAQSRFREVLYLDADTVPLVDPQVAFDWSVYRDHGLLLWPDRVNIKATNPVWARLGLEPTEARSIDSGVLLADKARVWAILDLAVVLNEHCSELYDLIHGDKDTFLLSTRLLDRQFGLVPHPPFEFEWDMVQRDPMGEPFLHHRTGGKWLLNHPNRPLAVPSLMARCEEALADLRRRWSGDVFHAPERSPRARAEEARLIGLRKVRYENSGRPPRDIELLRGGRVGAGRVLEEHWAIIDRDGVLLLQFYGSTEPVATLEKIGEGLWHGLGCEPGCEISLKEPVDDPNSRTDADDRPLRSARDHILAIAQPVWFAIGHDAERAFALEAALTLLSDIFDDVPEQIASMMCHLALSSSWRSFLEELVARLAIARDRRFMLTRREKTIRQEMLPPGMYAPADLTPNI
jgi:Mannosyltransferase putative